MAEKVVAPNGIKDYVTLELYYQGLGDDCVKIAKETEEKAQNKNLEAKSANKLLETALEYKALSVKYYGLALKAKDLGWHEEFSAELARVQEAQEVTPAKPAKQTSGVG